PVDAGVREDLSSGVPASDEVDAHDLGQEHRHDLANFGGRGRRHDLQGHADVRVIVLRPNRLRPTFAANHARETLRRELRRERVINRAKKREAFLAHDGDLATRRDVTFVELYLRCPRTGPRRKPSHLGHWEAVDGEAHRAAALAVSNSALAFSSARSAA